MATGLDDTFDRLAAAAAAVGHSGLLARAEATHTVHGDVEHLVMILAVSNDRPAFSARRARAEQRLGLVGYRLARGLLGPVAPGTCVSGDDIVDLVEGGTLFGRVPTELLNVADELMRGELVQATVSDSDVDPLWRAFDVGVVVAVASAGLATPGTSSAA